MRRRATSPLPQDARGAKEWRGSVSEEIRQHLILKMVSVAKGTPSNDDTKLAADQARKAEIEIFGKATSRLEYYRFMTNIIHKNAGAGREKEETAKSEKLEAAPELPKVAPQTLDLKAQFKEKIKRHSTILLHASSCKDGACNIVNCKKLKEMLQHYKECKINPKTTCAACKVFRLMSLIHSKTCTQEICSVHLCATLKKPMNPSQGLNIQPGNPSNPNLQQLPVPALFTIWQQPLCVGATPLPPMFVDFPSLQASLAMHQQFENLANQQSNQRQLESLLHSSQCLKRQRDSAANGEPRRLQCPNPYCRLTMSVLVHMETCQAGSVCPDPQCASSHHLLLHWKRCTSPLCRVCLPLRNKYCKHPVAAAQSSP